MSPTIFISHAGADSVAAAKAAAVLHAAGMTVRIDRAELRLGDSFLRFMNDSLTTSDYCLLLWSRKAAATPWVELEWEAALVRSVREKRGFLVVANLEPMQVPALLAPRLHVDLFPELEAGLAPVVTIWQTDRAVAQACDKPVANVRVPPDNPDARDEIYLISELFAIAVPWPVDLDTPAAILLAQIVHRLGLPAQVDHAGRFGLRMSYRLAHDKQPLAAEQPLREQGIHARTVIRLETAVQPFAASGSVDGGAFASWSFRRAGEAPKALRTAIGKAGAGLS